MSNVRLWIGGREYAVACAAGEEAHVAQLGVMIDEKLDELPQAVAHSEVRSLLFAALLLADEIVELRGTIEDTAKAGTDPALAERLVAIAERLEVLATQIDATP
ncbi:MAG TPA: cell division protein ZapA [Novosphingobium sp.]|nr:cell division protein ZapA [Novosphingobium sp.]